MTLQEYLLQDRAPATATSYEREIHIYTDNYPGAEKAGYPDILNYIGALRGRYNNARTLSRILSSIKAYYGYLCQEGIRDDHPASSIQLKDTRSQDIQLQDLFSREELEEIRQQATRGSKPVARNKVLMSLLIYQALYPGEMAALTIGDINLEAGTIRIKGTGKTNSRELTLQAGQVLLFYQYIRQQRTQWVKDPVTDRLLVSRQGRPLTTDDINHYVKRSCKEPYPGRTVNAQTIRQSVIANLLKQGHPLHLVQHFAGHKKPSTTERYRQNEVETLQTAIEQYHPIR